MNLYIKLTVAAALLVFLSGCIQYRAPVYEPSANTLAQLQHLNGQQVMLGEVSRVAGETDNRYCRGQGLVKTSGGDYASYVERALRTELNLAGLLADQADTRVSATLERMEFNSWNNSWDMVLALHSSNGNSYSTHSRFKGNTASLEYEAACHLAAQALPAAVRQLLRDALTHDDFAHLLTPNS